MNNFDLINYNVPIVELLSHLGIEIGNDKKFECPLHAGQRHAGILDETNAIWCFPDSKRISVIDTYIAIKNCTPSEAVKELSRIYNISLNSYTQHFTPRTEIEQEWTNLQKDNEGLQKTLDYLKNERKLSDDSISAVKTLLRYNPNKCRQKKEGGFEGRYALALPIRRLQNEEICGIWYRWLDAFIDDTSKGEKADKSRIHGSPFTQGAFFYLSKRDLMLSSSVFICEAVFDALSLYDYARSRDGAVISTMNCNAGALNADLSLLYGKKIYIAFDNDEAGQKGAKELYQRLTFERQDAQLIEIPAGNSKKDWNEILQSYGSDLPQYVEYRSSPILNHNEGIKRNIEHRQNQTYVEIESEKSLSVELLCDFQIRAVQRTIFYDFYGNVEDTAQRTAFVRTGIAESLKYPLKVISFFENSNKANFNSPQYWETNAGVIFSEREFKHYLITARNMIPEQKSAVRIVGITRSPDNAQKYQLVDGALSFQQRNESLYWNYEFPSGSIEDGREVLSHFARIAHEGVGLVTFYHLLLPLTRAFITGGIPHLMLKATKGTGKTVWQEFIRRVFNYPILARRQFATQFRRSIAFNRATMPIIVDEISRFNEFESQAIINDLAEWYTPSTSISNAERITWWFLGVLVGFGQDIISDASLTTKTLRLCLDGKKNPKHNPETIKTPKFPLKEFAEFLIEQEYKKPFNGLLNEETEKLKPEIKILGSDISRFVHNWGLIFAIRARVREFLEFTAEDGCTPELDADKERSQLIMLMKENASEVLSEAKESVEILKNYAAIITGDALERYPVILDDFEVGINPESMIRIVNKLNKSAITTGKRLVQVMKLDGLLDKKAEPKRRKFRNQTPNFYFLSRQTLESFGIDFPMPSNYDSNLYNQT